MPRQRAAAPPSHHHRAACDRHNGNCTQRAHSVHTACTQRAHSVHTACTQRASRLGPVPRAHVPRCVSEGGAAGAASAAGRMALPPASVCACLHQRGWLLSVPPLTSFASLLALSIALGGLAHGARGQQNCSAFLALAVMCCCAVVGKVSEGQSVEGPTDRLRFPPSCRSAASSALSCSHSACAANPNDTFPLPPFVPEGRR